MNRMGNSDNERGMAKQSATREVIDDPLKVRSQADRSSLQNREQVKDLRHQLNAQLKENARLQDTMAKRTADYEDKLKKMRELFAQSTKNLDKYRASVSAKESEYNQLKDELEKCQAQEQEWRSNVEAQHRDIERLRSETNTLKAQQTSHSNQLEAQVRQLSLQLERTKTDYEQYKKRANIVLKQNTNDQSGNTRINELEITVNQLQREKSVYETDQKQQQKKYDLLAHDLRESLKRIQQLEIKANAFNKSEQERIASQEALSRLHEEMAQERTSFGKAMASLTETHESTVRKLKDALMAKEMESLSIENRSDQSSKHAVTDFSMQQLQEENAKLKEDLAHLQALYEKQKQASTPVTTSPSSSAHDDSVKANFTETSEEPSGDVYTSMSQLISPFVTRPDSQEELKKQVQRLATMLQESEERVAALSAQEKVLKNEIRKLDAFDKRQNMNAEYLKNVLLKFLQSDNKAFMVPVLAKLLCLDDAETAKLESL
ncbi:uncharacterized protein BYT42DRAFT_578387 [Radiomyces spectabilis]|uniref:uncharacterized protein n=1 Tax=Radiomyces spectabilis TaxID=64574 RepID=UPI00221FCE77|nr:uncharacterized protein BYT42DRAFT_578387 [Radiomyces spectabilis]KAI8372898.1 hypothetical protein BYT42DRAFT_578387 [Radiomyces spectabilis]